MDEKEKKLTQKIIYTVAIAVIIGLPLINFLRYCNNLVGASYYKYFRQSYFIYALIPILLVTYVYAVVKKEFKIKYTDIYIYILSILGVISTIFAVDVKTSIFGEVIRYEGLLALFFYYLLFLNIKNLKSEKYKKNIIKVFIIVALLQLVYSILQVYTNIPFVMRFTYENMAIGVVGNPNFYGSYMVMITLITGVLYCLNKHKIFLYLTILLFIGLCLASSTCPILGFVLAYAFFGIVFIKKINLKRFILLTIVLIGLFFGVDKSVTYIRGTIFNTTIYDSYNVKKEIINSVKDIKNKNVSANKHFASGRLKIWENSIPAAKKYFWFGAGIDNFANVYPQTSGLIYDKAHNVYLQMLITNGVFALITYCAICLIIFIKGFKLKDSFAISLFIAFVGYCIQAFGNISVIDVAPIFFMILGMLYTYIPKKDKIST